MNNLNSKVCLITGANSGLGKETAIGLAKLGATVVIVCRSRERGETARRDIMASSGSTAVDLMVADLSSQAAIHHLVSGFEAKYGRLDVLVNNAGTVFQQRKLTVDDIESTFAVNHLASFLLTNLLMNVIKASAPARIVNVGTRLNTTLKFDDLQFEKRPYRGLQAYAESKLGNIMFTYELAQRLQGTGVTVNCVHPGVFKSNLGGTDSRNDEPFLLKFITTLGRPFLADAAKAAERVLYLAASPEVEGVSGRYFGDKKEIPSPPQTHDEAARRQLWAVSAALTKLDP